MSFNEIYDTFWKELYIVAYRKLRNRFEVEDMLQDIFLSVAERTTVLEKQGSIRYYLHQALKNKVIDFYRKEATKNSFDVEWNWLFEEAATETADNILINTEIKNLIQEKVDEMPERMRLIHELSREHHLEHKEIAQRLGISVQTVKNQLGVAMRRLRMALKNYQTYSFSLLIFCFSLFR